MAIDEHDEDVKGVGYEGWESDPDAVGSDEEAAKKAKKEAREARKVSKPRNVDEQGMSIAEATKKWEKAAGAPEVLKGSESNVISLSKGFGGSEDGSADNIPAGTPMARGFKTPQSDTQPKIPLGEPVHARIYAETMAGTGADEDTIQKHIASWRAMSPSTQREWQKTPEGSSATAAAIKHHEDTYVQGADSADVQKSKLTSKVKRAFFPSDEAQQGFEEKGTLIRGGRVEDVANPRDPAQRDALGEPRTEPEWDWKKAWHANLTSDPRFGDARKGQVGMALHADPSHHQALSDHIDALQARLPHGARPLGFPLEARVPSRSGATSYTTAPHFGIEQVNGGFDMANGRRVLQGQQFDTKGMAVLNARMALAQSAKAHSLGMHREAVSYFNQASEHAANLANIIHENNRTRGAQPGTAQLDADEDKSDAINSAYRKSVEHRR